MNRIFVLFLILAGCTYTRTTPSRSDVSSSSQHKLPATESGVLTTIIISPNNVKIVSADKDGNITPVPEDIKIDSEDKIILTMGDGQELQAPSTSHIQVTIHKLDKKTEEMHQESEFASAQSASLTSTNPKALDMKTQPAKASLSGGVGASGGIFDVSIKSLSSGTNLCVIGGILCIVGGVIVALILGLRLVGIGLGVAGFGLITIGTMYANYPWIAPVIIIPVIIGLGILLYFELRKGVRKGQTLEVVTKGIHKAPEKHRKQVTESIKTEAGSSLRVVKEEISNIKAKCNMQQ